MPSNVKKNLNAVQKQIDQAAERSGRSPAEIKLVAVSKTYGAETIRTAVKAGQRAFGENKIQEAESKIGELGYDGYEWHLIGHLQKNKARKAVQLFDMIHSVDSPELALRLDKLCAEEGRKNLKVLVQVDLAGESSKSGIAETDLQMLVESLKRCENLSFEGLMLLPPFFDDAEEARPYFQRLREIRDRLAGEAVFANGFGHLSMGMSHDLEIAIEEGATIVRIGTAIFGERN